MTNVQNNVKLKNAALQIDIIVKDVLILGEGTESREGARPEGGRVLLGRQALSVGSLLYTLLFFSAVILL